MHFTTSNGVTALNPDGSLFWERDDLDPLPAPLVIEPDGRVIVSTGGARPSVRVLNTDARRAERDVWPQFQQNAQRTGRARN